MNQRILELAEQAGFNPVNCTGSNVPLFEKFAQLMVEEVLAVQERLMAHGHNAWHLDGPTRKHFGVEK